MIAFTGHQSPVTCHGASAFAAAWADRDAAHAPLPQRVRKIRTVSREFFVDAVAFGSDDVARALVTWLAAGDVLIVRRLFEPDWLRALKGRTFSWMQSQPPSFHKMVERSAKHPLGSPDFHRVIDLEAGRNYAFAGCKHSAYFYRWNDDPLNVWPVITPLWRLAKAVMGLDPLAYETFTPKDGVVDRVQVVHYPPAIGYLEPHQDPYLHQRLFFSVYMSQRNRPGRAGDFHGGGFYLVGANDEVVEVEDQIEVGDACLGYATLMHGVAPCDRHKAPDWNSPEGRWFLSLYSNASDEVPQRHTGKPAKLALPGVLPDGVTSDR